MSEQTLGPDPALSGTLSHRVPGFCATSERTELEMLSRRTVQTRRTLMVVDRRDDFKGGVKVDLCGTPQQFRSTVPTRDYDAQTVSVEVSPRLIAAHASPLPRCPPLLLRCYVVHSCVVHPCFIVPTCPLPRCPLSRFQRPLRQSVSV